MADRIKTSDLKSRFLHLAQTSVFTVKLQPPVRVTNYLRDKGFNYNNDGEGVELRCKTMELPGSALQTVDQFNDYAGITERMAYRRDFDRLSNVEFYVDGKYDVIQMFSGWLEYISGQVDNDKSAYKGYRMRYPNSYKTNMTLTKFEKGVGNNKNEENNTILEYTFVNAFPIATFGTPVSYESSSVMTYSVSIEFSKYTMERKTV
jgi:hypothetical protein